MRDIPIGTPVRITDDHRHLTASESGRIHQGPERLKDGCVYEYMIALADGSFTIANRRGLEVLAVVPWRPA